MNPAETEVLGEKAYPRARAAGLEVIQDRCIRAAHREMLAEGTA